LKPNRRNRNSFIV